MKLETLTRGIEGVVEPAGEAWRSVRICDVTEDSRTVLPGSLFVARRGTQVDGLAFVAEAIDRGAAAVLTTDDAIVGEAGGVPVILCADVPRACALIAERWSGDPSQRLFVIGVTGTNGKTTTGQLIYRVLRSSGVRTGLISTVLIDDGVEIAASEMTTPPAIEVSRTLGLMVDAGYEVAVVEASSHALDQCRVAGLDFDVAVFTNLSGDHQDYHGSMEAYAQAKAKLFAMLSDAGLAVVNVDDPASETMLSGCKGRVVQCTSGDVRVVGEGLDALELELIGLWGEICVKTGLVGAHNAMNVLEAATVCAAFGLNREQLVRGLTGVKGPTGRLDRVGCGGCGGGGVEGGPAVFVDFAHTDDGLASAIGSLRRAMDETSGQLWVVFGCGGLKDQTKRARMGAAAARLADRVVVTSDNPRGEDPMAIIAQIMQGVPVDERERVHVEQDRKKAIEFTLDEAGEGDVILLAGKGHEQEQELTVEDGSVCVIDFDEVKIAREALDRRADRLTPVIVTRRVVGGVGGVDGVGGEL